MRRSRFDILGLGAVAVDDLMYVEAYPPADGKAQVLERERRCGGLTAVALATAARLGARCGYAGILGQDELSAFALDWLKRDGIDVSETKCVRGARPIHSNIVVDRRRGTRNIFYDLSRAKGAREDLPPALIRACRVLFVDHVGINGMFRAARTAHQVGVPVVADFERAQDKRFGELLARTDHLILSQDFAAELTGKRDATQSVRRLARQGHEVTIVTCGAEGCWYMAAGWPAPRHAPAFQVKPLDTTGCGDVFHGAYAFALAQGLPLEARLQLASAVAALKACSPNGEIPSLSQVQRFMREKFIRSKRNLSN